MEAKLSVKVADKVHLKIVVENWERLGIPHIGSAGAHTHGLFKGLLLNEL